MSPLRANSEPNRSCGAGNVQWGSARSRLGSPGGRAVVGSRQSLLKHWAAVCPPAWRREARQGLPSPDNGHLRWAGRQRRGRQLWGWLSRKRLSERNAATQTPGYPPAWMGFLFWSSLAGPSLPKGHLTPAAAEERRSELCGAKGASVGQWDGHRRTDSEARKELHTETPLPPLQEGLAALWSE